MFAVVTLEQLARVRITGDLLFDGIKVDDSINARRDVAEMAQRSGKMIDLDVGIWSRTGLNALQKVGVMRGEIGAGGGLDVFDELVFTTIDLPASFLFATDDHAFGAIPSAAVFVAFLHILDQSRCS